MARTGMLTEFGEARLKLLRFFMPAPVSGGSSFQDQFLVTVFKREVILSSMIRRNLEKVADPKCRIILFQTDLQRKG